MELLLTSAVNRLLARFVKSVGGEAGSNLRVSLGASGTVVRVPLECSSVRGSLA